MDHEDNHANHGINAVNGRNHANHGINASNDANDISSTHDGVHGPQ
jgi:hypothetical protein